METSSRVALGFGPANVRAVSYIGWHGEQNGVVSLAERKLRISKPRLRRKGKSKSREVEIPAYEAMRTQSWIGGRMLDILMRGVSTRSYREVLPEMAETIGVSKSQVSREFIEASEKALKELMERRFFNPSIRMIGCYRRLSREAIRHFANILLKRLDICRVVDLVRVCLDDWPQGGSAGTPDKLRPIGNLHHAWASNFKETGNFRARCAPRTAAGRRTYRKGKGRSDGGVWGAGTQIPGSFVQHLLADLRPSGRRSRSDAGGVSKSV